MFSQRRQWICLLKVSFQNESSAWSQEVYMFSPKVSLLMSAYCIPPTSPLCNRFNRFSHNLRDEIHGIRPSGGHIVLLLLLVGTRWCRHDDDGLCQGYYTKWATDERVREGPGRNAFSWCHPLSFLHFYSFLYSWDYVAHFTPILTRKIETQTLINLFSH